MTDLPKDPFQTDDFSLGGGGIDFLGLRWVNLNFLGSRLIPQINNVTTEIGTFMLGVWIPWVFLREASKKAGPKTTVTYRRFREKVEVLMSYAIREGSAGNTAFGKPRKRVGVEQKLVFPSVATFAEAKRGQDNSIYAAPQYGPALYSLEFFKGDTKAISGATTRIPFVDEKDQAVLTIINWVDENLRRSQYYDNLISLEDWEVNEVAANDLSNCGLHTCFHRYADKIVKSAFLEKLLPEGSPRKHTTNLIIETTRLLGALSSQDLRKIWHTRIGPDGNEIFFSDPIVENQRLLWSLFESRQVQRYFTEAFLCCFERGIEHHRWTTMSDLTSGFMTNSGEYFVDKIPKTFRELIESEIEGAGMKFDSGDMLLASREWNAKISAYDESYDFIKYTKTESAFANALKSAARWWLRLHSLVVDEVEHEVLNLGGHDRISMAFAHNWILQRLDDPLDKFAYDLLSDIVFTQHLRVALARLDGHSQKLRFTLVDEGIAPTAKVTRFGQTDPPWMSDRLECLIALLIDSDVLKDDGKGRVSVRTV